MSSTSKALIVETAGSALYCCNYSHVSSFIGYFEVTWRRSKDRFPPKVCDPATRRNLWRHGLTVFCYINWRPLFLIWIFQCLHWFLCIVDSTLPPIYGSGSLCVPYVLSTCSCLFESCNVTTRFRKPRATFSLIHVPYICKNREALIVLFICLCADTLGVLARTIGSDNFISLADECIQLGLVGSKPDNLTVKRQYDAPPTCMSGGRRTAG